MGQLVKVFMKKVFLGSKRNVKDIFVFKFERDNKYDSLSF